MANRTVAVQLKAEIGQYVAGLSKASAATMRLGESAQSSQVTASKHFDIAGKAGLLMGGAIVAGLGLAISKSMEFETSMSAVGAATGATAATLGDLRDAAMKAGADTQYSATEAADAITEMAKAGVSAKDIMGGGLSGALSLAAAGQIDVADAAGIASTAMTQFSLTGKDLPHVADLLAAGAGKAMGSVGDLGAALNQSGLIASAAGLSIEETTAGLSAFASAGLIGSDAGTSFKTMLQAIQAPSGKAAETMSDLGLNMYDANGKMLGLADMAGQLQTHLSGLTDEQRNSALATIFGSDAVRAANVLYKEGASGITDWTGKVNDAGYAQEQAAALTDNLKGDLERLGGSFDTLMISIGQGAQGPLRDLVQMFGGVLDGASGLVGIVGNLPGPVVAAAAAFGTWAIAGDTIMSKLGVIKESMGSGAWGAFTEALGYAKENGDGLGEVLGSVGDVAMDSARGGLKALAKAVGPELGLAVAGYLASTLVSNITALATAGDDAAHDIDDLKESIKSADNTSAKFDATSAGLDDLKKKVVDTQAAIDAIDNQSYFHKVVISPFTGDGGDLKNYEENLKHYKAEIDQLTDAQARNAATANALGKQYQMSRDDVIALADANGIDLSTGLDAVQSSFGAAATAAKDAAAGTALLGDMSAMTVSQVEDAAKAVQDWRDQLQGIGESFVEPLGVYKGLLDEKTQAERTAAENTAAATDSSKDSWKDYVSDVSVSLDEYATKLEEQITAQENWRANIAAVTQRGGLEVGQILAAMGVEGAGLTEQMANATGEDFARMRDDLIRDAQLGGAGAAAELDTAMKVMAEIGAQGGSATALAVAQKLGLGLADVRGIAAQYGVELATGLDPLLTALGSRTVALQARGGGMANNSLADKWVGGYTGDGGKYEPKAVVHGGEYVFTKEQTAKAGVDRLEAYANSLDGYANGGFVTSADVPKPRSTAPYGPPISTAGNSTMQTGYDETVAWMKANAAMAGAGPLGGDWQSIAAIVQAAIPQARINSTYRPGDPGYHGKNKAVDFGFGSGPGGAGSAGLASIARFLYSGYGHTLAELIYDGIGDNTPDVKNGADHVYNAATRAEHANHVHAAVYHQGTDYVPQTGFAYLEKGEAVIPASANPRSREFSGGVGGWGGGGSANVPAPVVTVFAQFGDETIEARATRVVIGALTGTTQRGDYNG